MFGGANSTSRSGLLNFFIIAGFLYYLVFQDFRIIADIIFSTNHNISEALDFFLSIEKNQQDWALLDLSTEISRNVTEQKETSFCYYESPENRIVNRVSSQRRAESSSSNHGYPHKYKGKLDFDFDDDDDDDTEKTSQYKWENLGIGHRIFVICISLAGGYLLACTVSALLDFIFGPGTGLGSSGGSSGRRPRRR